MPCACPRFRRNGAALRCFEELSFLQVNAWSSHIERPVFYLIGYVAVGHEFFALPMSGCIVLLLYFYCGGTSTLGRFSLPARVGKDCLCKSLGLVIAPAGTLAVSILLPPNWCDLSVQQCMSCTRYIASASMLCCF